MPLGSSQQLNHKVTSDEHLLILEENFEKAHSKGPLGRSYTHDREISAIDPRILPVHRYVVFPSSYQQLVSARHRTRTLTQHWPSLSQQDRAELQCAHDGNHGRF
jgi:hypothetical protein